MLGGMGPLATVDFLAKLIAATPAAGDVDHVPLVASSIPQIPSRVAAILAGGASPIPALLDARDRLLAAGATLLAMPCNTAHRWYDDLARGIDVPFLHIADAATDDVARARAGRRDRRRDRHRGDARDRALFGAARARRLPGRRPRRRRRPAGRRGGHRGGQARGGGGGRTPLRARRRGAGAQGGGRDRAGLHRGSARAGRHRPPARRPVGRPDRCAGTFLRGGMGARAVRRSRGRDASARSRQARPGCAARRRPAPKGR
ncbi:MAG: aspartate/glutamate racemase family protein [Betaproteobacteria bacterium]|nr:aspartate/glutamate racemase family protein [Betaproteobacteria bacterium]